MQSLNKLVLDKIKELGLQESAEYFGKSVGTIRAWQNKQTVSVEAVEKVLADASGAHTGGTVNPPETAVPAQPPTTPPQEDDSFHEFEHKEIWDKLINLNTRVSGIETHIRRENGLPPLSAVDPIHSQVVPPRVAPQPAIQQVTQPVETPPVILPTEIADGENLPRKGDWLRPHRIAAQRF